MRSVVYTDRALNHMSEPFKKAMNNISDTREQHAAKRDAARRGERCSHSKYPERKSVTE